MNSPAKFDPSGGNRGVVFTFPGQGSYHYSILHELYTAFPETGIYFHQADGVARRFLRHAFLPLVTAPTQEAHDTLLSECPNLDQLGIYITEVCIATLLMRAGVKPEMLVGHSLGELAALTIAGVYGVETGCKIVCQRVLALQEHGSSGGMAAASCDSRRVQEIIGKAGESAIEISVVNHPRQTVLSGPVLELQRLSTIMSQHGICLTLLKSRYPFHSRFLQEAVRSFRSHLVAYDFQPAAIPVLLCTEERLCTADVDLVETLASHFVRTLNFSNIVDSLYAGGHRIFIECGAGDIVTKLASENLKGAADVICLPAARLDRGVKKGLGDVLRWAAEEQIVGPVLAPAVSEEFAPQDVQLLVSSMMNNLSVLVQDMAALVEKTSALMQFVARTGLGGPLPGLPNGRNLVSANATRLTHVGQDQSLNVDHVSRHAPSVTDEPSVGSVGSSPPGTPDARRLSTSAPKKPEQPSVRLAANRSSEMKYLAEECREVPIAIVSLGCVLPGASNPKEYWENIKNGVGGIIDLAQTDPTTAQDFLGGDITNGLNIVPDKTYTLLNGTILDVTYDAALLASAYNEDEFHRLTRGQRLLAVAIAQSVFNLKNSEDSRKGNIQCILGATADGSSEYDEARFLDSIHAMVQELDEPQPLRETFSRILEDVLGCRSGDSGGLTQHSIYQDVVRRFLPRSCRTYVVDSACSSSLYSINLGIKALRTFESDIILAGGVFAPGPANNTLFAQFRGLTPNQSRPLDEGANGVVFGDGAAIVVLKRLPDALAGGDRVLGVIRGMGLSSDGKSPSIYVPQASGQSRAMRRVYEKANIDLDTIQYVEAHATATPVGDAVEFSALKEVMRNRDTNLPPIEIGSVKALIGHTGWVSGVASVIKICKAFEEGLIPRQYNYRAPNKDIHLEGSGFSVATESRHWPENVRSLPRRAGINSFGFGGTNAHLVLEEFDEPYHRNLCARLRSGRPQIPAMAVVAVGALFPSPDGLETESRVVGQPVSARRFIRKCLRLPEKKILLPDVKDHMDISQYLSALAAEKIFASLPERWQTLRDEVGVVLGLESKTERGVSANERIYLDRLRRLVTQQTVSKDMRRILDKLSDRIRQRTIPSGPYTLPGLMPNVTASRIVHMFDLNGPNIVIDSGDNSLFQAVDVAQHLLGHRDCKMVLAGGINAVSSGDNSEAEAAIVLALTTEETAQQAGFPILGLLDVSRAEGVSADGAREIDTNRALNYRGAQGCVEILHALSQVKEGTSAVYVREHGGSPGAKGLVFFPVRSSDRRVRPMPVPQNEADATQKMPDTHAYVQNTAIYCYTPIQVDMPASDASQKLAGRRILFLTDQPSLWTDVERTGALNGIQYDVACPEATKLRNALAIDLTTDEAIASSLKVIDPASYDTIIAVKDLGGRANDTLLRRDLPSERVFLDLLFVIGRHAYEHIRAARVSLITLCLNAYRPQGLDPFTGLVAGFMKSVSRELPDSTCRIINTDDGDVQTALKRVETELGQTGEAGEVCFQAGKRRVVRLRPMRQMALAREPYLDSNSVVIATGGGRGVTGVLCEALLKRFGCTVVALGRTDTASAPDVIRNMDEESFRRHEPQFYRDELAKDKTKKIVDLKKQYQVYQAVNELNQTLKRLRELPGRFEYLCVDINDEQAVEKVVRTVHEKYGRLDLVLHGAGVQVSKVLTKKSIKDFRNIVATKLASLGHLFRACEKYRGNHPTNFHILTSAFSYMGNDGQPDYGAANEAMNRLAASMNNPSNGAFWSSLAWLGWAGVGMTRGSEYAALAASRKLRGVTKEEGQEIFSALMEGPPTAPINILLADGEIAFYKVDIQREGTEVAVSQIANRPVAQKTSKHNKRDSHVTKWDISLDNTPFLRDHVVNGLATVPAAFLTTLVAETARQLRPDLKILSFEDTHYLKFVRVPEGRGVELRLSAQVVSETETDTVIKIRALSDFVHKSGIVLQKDILHTDTVVRMAKSLGHAPSRLPMRSVTAGRPLPDPYVLPGSVVQLDGQFDGMANIRVGVECRRGEYLLRPSPYPEFNSAHLVPSMIMMDSFWRFGAIHETAHGTLPLYVPEVCGKMNVYYDFTDFGAPHLTQRLIFSGENPSGDGDLLRLGNIEVSDQAGNILLTVEGAVCRKFGEVHHALAT